MGTIWDEIKKIRKEMEEEVKKYIEQKFYETAFNLTEMYGLSFPKEVVKEWVERMLKDPDRFDYYLEVASNWIEKFDLEKDLKEYLPKLVDCLIEREKYTYFLPEWIEIINRIDLKKKLFHKLVEQEKWDQIEIYLNLFGTERDEGIEKLKDQS